jgi:hypothetical protein
LYKINFVFDLLKKNIATQPIVILVEIEQRIERVIFRFQFKKKTELSTKKLKRLQKKKSKLAGSPVFTGSASVYIYFQFFCPAVLSLDRIRYRSGFQFDRPVRF